MTFSRAQLIQNDCRDVVTPHIQDLALLKNQTILITGGTGFVGTWLTELLAHLNRQHDFNVQIYLLSQKPEKMEQIAPHLLNDPKIKFIQQDVRSYLEFPSEVSFVIHAAASPDSRQHASDPIKTYQTIVRGTESVMEACARLNMVKKIINLSSGLVYGPHFAEQKIGLNAWSATDPSSMNNVYLESKRMAEMVASVYRSQYRLPVITVRPFAFVGPYQALDKPWAINNFIRDVIHGNNIRILGDGETVRSYLYASDMAYWLLKMLCVGQDGCSYNLGSPEAISLKSLAAKIANLFSKTPTVDLNLSAEHNNYFVPDIHAAEGLGLKVSVRLEDALKKTVDWFNTKQ